MKNVTVGGMIYQIGAIYEFYFDDIGWGPDILKGISRDDDYPFGCESDSCSQRARLVSHPIGAITPAPAELIDGAAYSFELSYDLWVGFYRASRKSFFTQFAGGNKICATGEPSNIRRLEEAK